MSSAKMAAILSILNIWINDKRHFCLNSTCIYQSSYNLPEVSIGLDNGLTTNNTLPLMKLIEIIKDRSMVINDILVMILT